MPTDQPIRFVSSSLRWRDCPKAIPQSPPAPREWLCSGPPMKSISRRHVLRDDECVRADVRVGPQLPPSTQSKIASRSFKIESTDSTILAPKLIRASLSSLEPRPRGEKAWRGRRLRLESRFCEMRNEAQTRFELI